MTEPKIGQHYNILVMIQVRAGEWDQVAAICEAALEAAKRATPALLPKTIGPLLAFGRQDMLFALQSTDLEMGTRIVYEIINEVDEKTSAIENFSYILGFAWESLTTDTQAPIAGVILLKYNPESYESQEILAVELANMLSSASLDAKARSARMHVDIVGGFAWHEAILYVYTDRYDELLRLAHALRNHSLIHRVVTIPVMPYLPGPAASVAAAMEGVLVLTRIGIKGGVAPSRTINLPNTLNSIKDYGVGRYPLSLTKSHSSVDDFLAVCQEISESADLGAHASELRLPLQTEPERSFGIDGKTKRASRSSNSRPIVSEDRFRDAVEKDSVPTLKLQGLLTQVNLISRSKDFASLVPPALGQEIRNIIMYHDAGQLTSQEVLYYISEIQGAILERTAPAYLDPMDPMHQAVKYSGGGQRLILACEKMLSMCYRFHDEMVAAQTAGSTYSGPLPVVLAFFDYNEDAPPRPTSEAVLHAAGHGLPIVIRLPMMKYKPWLWPIGIGVLAEFLGEPPGQSRQGPLTIPAGFTCAELGGQRLPSERIDDFVARFVALDPYKRTLDEYLHVSKRIDGKRTLINKRVEDYLNARLIKFRPRVERHAQFNKRVEFHQGKIRKGEVNTNVAASYEEFTAFINAYLQLSRAERRSARALSTFVVSLNKSPIMGRK